MYSRLLMPPKNKSFFLFGPRGTGKTTWVKKTFPHGLYFDLLEAEIYNDFLANPQRLENFIPANFRDWIIIDELQRVPHLLNEIHRLIEQYHYKFVLTGSSPRKLRKQGENLLAGRALTYHLYPLTSSELNTDFDLGHSLKYGHLPSVFQEDNPQKYLESYVQTYLQEEIQQESLTRNLSAFARFLEIASFSQASVLNLSEVAREAAVERKVVTNYFTILENLLIAYRLPVFAKRAKRRLIAHPKFYFFDVGVYRTIRPSGPLDQPEMIEGAALETLFFQELLAINEYYHLGYRLFYYRTAAGQEIDFIAYGPKGIKAFEIKRTGKIFSPMLTNLKSFLQDYPQSKGFFIYGGKKPMRMGAIEIIPFSQCLKNLPQILNQNHFY